MTYLTAVVILWMLHLPLPLLQALIPSGGYLLSTLSLPWIKRWWMQSRTIL
ncbi:hypothetical protein HY285_01530 [Candidatus Peregrinibacteria bacterium]|nr:hypothetical protein [Candidatus Peregrinibacteria bacterium]MBI3816210.1 hypothetical protein [Candidatus Peregrinibacteria bacterium]